MALTHRRRAFGAVLLPRARAPVAASAYAAHRAAYQSEVGGNVMYPIFARGLAFLVGMLIAALIDINANIQAAPAEPVPPCMVVAKAGAIEISFCETDYGDFFINSVGFMAVAP